MWVLCGLLQTALHMASFNGDAEAIRALKEVGFTAFDAQNNVGEVGAQDEAQVPGAAAEQPERRLIVRRD